MKQNSSGKSSSTTRGSKYRSGFEKKIAKKLTDKNIKFKYESEHIKYTIPESEHTYTPDFVLPNGVIVEAKGKWDRQSRQKMALVIQQNPDKDIRMLFMRDNPIIKGSKTKYSDWCKKRNIRYAISETGEIPQEWLDEN